MIRLNMALACRWLRVLALFALGFGWILYEERNGENAATFFLAMVGLLWLTGKAWAWRGLKG